MIFEFLARAHRSDVSHACPLTIVHADYEAGSDRNKKQPPFLEADRKSVV